MRGTRCGYVNATCLTKIVDIKSRLTMQARKHIGTESRGTSKAKMTGGNPHLDTLLDRMVYLG